MSLESTTEKPSGTSRKIHWESHNPLENTGEKYCHSDKIRVERAGRVSGLVLQSLAGVPVAMRGFDSAVRRSNGPRIAIRQVEHGLDVVAEDYSDPAALDERGGLVYGRISLDEQVQVIGLSRPSIFNIDKQYKVIPREDKTNNIYIYIYMYTHI